MATMTRNELTAIVAAILTTMHEADSGVIESHLYMLCGMDMDKWDTLRGIIVRAGWVNIKGHYVTLTPKGTEMAIEIQKALTK